MSVTKEDVVLCRQCESGAFKVGRIRPGPLFERGQTSERMGRLLCDRCASVLPATCSDDYMLRRLQQLSRFGIGAECAPILAEPEQE